MRKCAALCQYAITTLNDALALSERLLLPWRGRAAAHLAPKVVDTEKAGESSQAAEVGRRAEARDQSAHQHRAQRGADAVESEQRATRSHHLRRPEMII